MITTDAEYEAALARCWELMDSTSDADGDELQRLAVAVEKYEERFDPAFADKAAR